MPPFAGYSADEAVRRTSSGTLAMFAAKFLTLQHIALAPVRIRCPLCARSDMAAKHLEVWRKNAVVALGIGRMLHVHFPALWRQFLQPSGYGLNTPIFIKNRSRMLKPTNRDTTIASQYNVTLLAEQLAQASPNRVIEVAATALPGRLAVVSSFGTESAVLLKFVAEVDRSLPILFLDSLWLFKETLAYRDRLVAHLGLTNIHTITPSPSALALSDPKRDLCFSNRDACCSIRKVVPLAKELEAFDGWISGRKRYHGGERTGLAIVETDGRHLKFNPLAHLTLEEFKAIFAASDLPRHPLEAIGFTSVGCVPCTTRPASGAPVRDGRWSGLAKSECGIHMARPATTAAT